MNEKPLADYQQITFLIDNEEEDESKLCVREVF